MSGASLDDWANRSYVNVLFTCGECGFKQKIISVVLVFWRVGPVLRKGYGI